VYRQLYIRQLDDGKWGIAEVEFHFSLEHGKDVGEVVDFQIQDEKPKFLEEDIIYRSDPT
jgi:predicted metallo-beta-lactamase superfamily hydrolase